MTAQGCSLQKVFEKVRLSKKLFWNILVKNDKVMWPVNELI